MCTSADRFRPKVRILTGCSPPWQVVGLAAALRSPPTSDGRGLPRADPRVEWFCVRVAVVATLWLFAVGLWEIAGPFGAGHSAVVPARGIIAENMLSWQIWGPVRAYTLERPGPEAYYAHHPWGTFWLQAVMMSVFGRHEATFRLLPVLVTAMTPWLLYRLARALYSPVAGAFAAVGYAVLPGVLAFANFPGFEGPVIVGCLLTAWGGLRLLQTGARRWIWVSGCGLLWGFHSDWEFYVFAAVAVGGLSTFHLLLHVRGKGEVRPSVVAVWAALAVLLGLGSLALYRELFDAAGGVEALLEQGRFRAGAHRTALAEILERRAYWIEVMFTPVAIFVGKVGLPLLLYRLLVLRRSGDIFPLAMLLMATVHYVAFENGATVHIYWPLPYAPYFALALGLLAHCSAVSSGWLLHRFGRRPSSLPLWRSAWVLGIVPAVMLPDAIRALDYSRNSGLRLNDDGNLTLQDFDKARALSFFAERLPEKQAIALHASMRPNWAQEWLLHRPVRFSQTLAGRGDSKLRYTVLDTRFATPETLERGIGQYAITAVGPFWLVDGGGTAGELRAFALEQREPTWSERILVQSHDPVYSVAPDPWLDWELAVHWGRARPPPAATERLRLAHNAAIYRGHSDQAERLRVRLLSACDRSVHTVYDNGAELLAACRSGGVAPGLDLYFWSPGAAAGDLQFDVRSVMTSPPALSWVRLDDKERALGRRFRIPPSRWKRGFIYDTRIELRQRPGAEEFYGQWLSWDGSPAPRARERIEPITLLVLP